MTDVAPGGGDRIRTDDPLVANQVLYQLSYAPDRESWWACADLNRGPPAYQADALNQLSYKPQDGACHRAGGAGGRFRSAA